MRIGDRSWFRRWTLGSGGFLGEVTLISLTSTEYVQEVFWEYSGRVVALTDLFVHPLRRGKGWSDELLQTATDYADRHKLTIVLEVQPYGGGKLSRRNLEDLYIKHGFVIDTANRMIRYVRN